MIRREFWDTSNISKTLKEIIEPEGVDVTSIKMNENLHPLIWGENDEIISDIRKVLLKNAVRFIEFCDIDNLKFKDIILTGSMANYNYNENSDLDVHIVLDYKQISKNKEFVSDFFKLKKQLWALKHPIQVKGHEVEMYIQDSKEKHHSSGTYSLVKNEWIKKPIKKIVDINTVNVKSKAADIMNTIDDLETDKNPEQFISKYDKLKNKLKKFRQTGLNREGEFSTENLAFKILRNTGYLKKLIDMKTDYLTKELSLNQE